MHTYLNKFFIIAGIKRKAENVVSKKTKVIKLNEGDQSDEDSEDDQESDNETMNFENSDDEEGLKCKVFFNIFYSLTTVFFKNNNLGILILF